MDKMEMWVPGVGMEVSASEKMFLSLPEEIREGLRGKFTLELRLEKGVFWEDICAGRARGPKAVCQAARGLLENTNKLSTTKVTSVHLWGRVGDWQELRSGILFCPSSS